MSKKSMVAINPQISLTIGNPEIVNMLVQQQVKALKNEQKLLEKSNESLLKIRDEGLVEIVASLREDYKTTHGKHLDALVKALSALTGRRHGWSNPYPKDVSGNLHPYYSIVSANYSRVYGQRKGEEWDAEDLKDDLKYSQNPTVQFGCVPTVAELEDWNDCWRDDFSSKEEAIQAYLDDYSEGQEIQVKLNASKETCALIAKYRLVDTERLPVCERMHEIKELLEDTANIEKAVLAQMTQNTLESNPELVEAFSVLTKGVLGLPYIDTKQLTVEAE